MEFYLWNFSFAKVQLYIPTPETTRFQIKGINFLRKFLKGLRNKLASTDFHVQLRVCC